MVLDIFQEVGLPLWLQPYEVLVTSSYTALIETIPDTVAKNFFLLQGMFDSVFYLALLFCYYCYIQIIFKMDKFGQVVQFQHFMLQQNKDLSFAGFTKQIILEMCILSGCDYLQSLPGTGL